MNFEKPPTGSKSVLIAGLLLLVTIIAAGLIWNSSRWKSRDGSASTAPTPLSEAAAVGSLPAAPTTARVPSMKPKGDAAASSAATVAKAPLASASTPVAVVPTTASLSATEPRPLEEPQVEINFDTHYILINGHRAHPTQLIAKLKAGGLDEAGRALLGAYDLRLKTNFPLTPNIVVLDSTKGLPAAVANAEEAKARGELMQDRIKALFNTGRFEYIEPDYVSKVQAVPNDSAFAGGTLWGLRNLGGGGFNGIAGADIDAVRAWDITTGSTSVIVAVVDSGINYNHSDLQAQMWRNPGEIAGNGVDDDRDGYIDNVFGINAITNSGNPMDDNGHGTHVAGTIGAAANGGGGHVGVAWQVRLMACKAGNSQGQLNDVNIIKAINFAVNKGAKVINASYGGAGTYQPMFDTLAAARDRGVLFIAAAGNGGQDGVGDNNDILPQYPATYNLSNIISVAALDPQDKLTSFSNFGPTTVDLGAPGLNIYSTLYTGGYGYMSGTSMAAPHVAGVAALVAARYPNISLAEFRQRILAGVVPIAALRGRTVTGGRLNAYYAVSAAGVPDGVLEVGVTPVATTQLAGGTNVTFTVQVTDGSPVTNATVVGTITGRQPVTFANNGVAPDATANDHIYSAVITVPNTGAAFVQLIEVTAPGKTRSAIAHEYPIRPSATNDNFAARTVLTGASANVTASNVGATRETGEPNHADIAGGKSVWWSWTAPAAGTATIKTDGSSFDTLLGVYTGGAVGALTRSAADDDAGSGAASLVSFNTTAGAVYQIAVDGVAGASGSITLSIAFVAAPPAPANDNFASSVLISGATATVNGSNVGATKQTGEPNHASNAGGRSVWWRWTAPATGIATIKTDGSAFDTTLGIYTGAAVNALTLIGGDNDGGEGPRSLVTFNATSGTTYQIAVDGLDGASGNIVLGVALVIPPPVPANDNFANRIAITGATATATGANTGATKEAGEPDHATNLGGRSIWWTWTAPSSGSATITTTGSTFDTLLGVYTGTAVASLTPVGSNNNDPSGGTTSRVSFNAVAGTIYQIAVDGNSISSVVASGSVTLNVTVAAPPGGGTNDSFANRIALTGSTVATTGSNSTATKESGEPRHANVEGGKSVWWSWTAPANGSATIKTAGSSFDTLLAVYTGNAVNALSLEDQSDDTDSQGGVLTSSVTFNVVAGTAYRIAVDGYGAASGTIALSIALGAAQSGPSNDHFANRTSLSGSVVKATGSNVGATKETSEPVHAGYFGGRSVWWRWTATQTGRVSLSTSGSSFDTLLAVYSGSSPATLSEVAANDDGGIDFTSECTFFATAGASYAIAVDGYQGGSGSVMLGLTFTETNDLYFTDFESFPHGSNLLSGTDGWTTSNNTNGISGIFQGFTNSKTAWLGYNTTTDASVAAWRTIGYNPVAAGTPRIQFQVDFSVNDSTNNRRDTFYFLLYNTAGDMIGGIGFDNNTQRIVRYDGNTLEDVGSFNRNTRYALTASFNFATNQWSALLGGTTLFTNKPMTGQNRALTLGDITAHWQIATAGSPGNNHLVFDNFRISLAVANDNFASASTLSGTSAQVIVNNQGTTKEVGEPNHAGDGGGHSVWWRWVAPSTGLYTFDTRGSTFDTLLAVYTGNGIGALTTVIASNDESAGVRTSSVSFTATAGVAYWIAVDGAGGAVGTISLNLRTGVQTPAASRLFAISCRAQVGIGGDVLIPGIIIGGTGSRQIVVRAGGPAIQGVNGTLARPELKLYQGGSSTPIATNTGWSSGTAAETNALRAAFASASLPEYPLGSADCALLASVTAGASYTAVVSGLDNTTGVALVEVYEVGGGNARMTALSCRAQVGTGGNILIPGLIIAGTQSKQVIIRAKGPSIIGVPGVLAQPTLALYNGSNVKIAENTRWSTATNAAAIAAATTAIGLDPFVVGSADCAILTTLSPGGYTAHVSGLNNTTGVALIEVYEVP